MKQTAVGLLAASLLFLTACAPGASSGSEASSQNENSQPPAAVQSTVPGASSSSPAPSRQNTDAYHKITAAQAKKMIDEGNVTIVDVRTPEEYADAHIEGAINVPNETVSAEPPSALPDKSAVLLVHCRTGVRSKNASEKLAAMGYEHIYDFGGIVDWTYGTVSGEE